MFMKDKKALKQLTYICLTAAQLVMPDNVYAGMKYASQAEVEQQQRIAVRQQNLKRLDDEETVRRKAVLDAQARKKEAEERATAIQNNYDNTVEEAELKRLKKAH